MNAIKALTMCGLVALIGVGCTTPTPGPVAGPVTPPVIVQPPAPPAPVPPPPEQSLFSEYRGDKWIEAPVYGTLVMLWEKVGYDPSEIATYRRQVDRICADGLNDDGWYCIVNGYHASFCLGCTDIPLYEFSYAAGARVETWPNRSADSITHECIHDLLMTKAGVNGHPEFAVINGKRWKITDLAPVRWPERVRRVGRTVGHYATFGIMDANPDPWRDYPCGHRIDPNPVIDP